MVYTVDVKKKMVRFSILRVDTFTSWLESAALTYVLMRELLETMIFSRKSTDYCGS